MEVYGRNSGRNGSQLLGHQVEWGPSGPVTVFQDSMMRVGLDSRDSYPERPGVPDCVYFLRTGSCGFGSGCRYNHPRGGADARAVILGGVEYPERVGEPACQFYLKTGTCKFGPSCKFHHPKYGVALNQAPLNIYGFPLRPGEKECSYYLKTGQCKFGVACKFHHPQVTGSMQMTAPPMVQPPPSVARPPLLPGSYVQGTYGPVLVSPGVVPLHAWNPYSAPVSPALSPSNQPSTGTGSMYGMTNISSVSALGPYQPPLTSSAGPSGSSNQKESIFPERPDQPECQYYLKTGDCKYGSSCRYHHPREWIVPQTNCVLSPLGLPMRPGVQPCAFYMQNGQCKFGTSCKFDHPVTMRYNVSTSSLTDVAVAPFPAGSSLAILAPSFSGSKNQN